MRILVLGNNFNGAYGSLKCFSEEMAKAFSKIGCETFLTYTVNEAVKIINSNTIDFSIGIGKYSFFCDGVPLYELFQVRHYQWIIDNPKKISIDVKSKFVKYILIDKLFSECISNTANAFMFLPLGVPDKSDHNIVDQTKEEGVVFAGQIRDSNRLYEMIKGHKYSDSIIEAVDGIVSDLDYPFILGLKRITCDMPEECIEDVFSLSNSFVRAYKREKTLGAINEYPVAIVGEVESDKLVEKKNVKLFGKKGYYEAISIIKKYSFCINIEPNFNAGFHDRIIRAIQNGGLLITNDGTIQRDIFGDKLLYFKYSSLEDICCQILNISPEQIAQKTAAGAEIVDEFFSWKKILSCVIADFKGENKDEYNRLYRVLGN